jgi:hypothetical protein
VVTHRESVLALDLAHGALDGGLQPRGRAHVDDATALPADEVVVVLGEVLGARRRPARAR